MICKMIHDAISVIIGLRRVQGITGVFRLLFHMSITVCFWLISEFMGYRFEATVEDTGVGNTIIIFPALQKIRLATRKAVAADLESESIKREK
ncbi:MAG: hypothetical protein ACMUIU_19995 [bacterium]